MDELGNGQLLPGEKGQQSHPSRLAEQLQSVYGSSKGRQGSTRVDKIQSYYLD
jgi:hypothetical protein